MADVRGFGRSRPRGAAKIKAHGVASSKPHAAPTSPHRSTVLPKLKLPPGNNNNLHDHSAAGPFSPRVREISVVLPIAPHPSRPSAPSLRPAPPPSVADTCLSTAKNAWSTPRSPVPETNSELSSSTPALDAFFQYDGTSVQTPSRLLVIEESLVAAEQLYQVDWERLRAGADKFVEIAGTAHQHLESVHGDLPFVASTSEETRDALVELTCGIHALHADQAKEKQKLIEEFDVVLARLTDERIALERSHAAEKLAMEQDHDVKLRVLTDDFKRQIREFETSAAAVERECLHEIESLKQKMVNELQQQVERAQDERDQLERKFTSEISDLRARNESELAALHTSSEEKYQSLLTSSQQEISELRISSTNEISALRTSSANEINEVKMSSEIEMSKLRASSADEINELKISWANEINGLRLSSANEISELKQLYSSEISKVKASSSNEIERLLEASASTLAEVTDKLTNELEETRQRAERELADVVESHTKREAELERSLSEKIAHLMNQHENQQSRLEHVHRSQVSVLENELAAARATHTVYVEQLTTRFQAELTTIQATLAAENSTLVGHYTTKVNELQLNHTSHVNKMAADHDTLVETLKLNHAEDLEKLQRETSEAHELLAQQHEAQRNQLRDESKRERDRIVLRYESDLEFLRRSTAEQLETFSKERDEVVQQLREAHAVRVLGLETAMRENEKRQSEQIAILEDELDDRKSRIHELESSESQVQEANALLTDQGRELSSRYSMRLEEMEAAIGTLVHVVCERDAEIERLKRDLRVSEDANHTKSNSLLELTFVIKSRDDEIEKLHAALLDSIQNVNTKTEILELTAETLSTKSKELEDTRTALRVETGRLSRVAEDVQHKAEMLEDSEMKIENMRLQLKTIRLEMKRLQMDMRLQHEHSAGEMELKQGEIRRLHAALTEIKQKNDIHQETIVCLETSLATATRQGDELRRRVELMKIETVQCMDDARKLNEEILEKDKQLAITAKESQTLHNDKQKLQIQLNNTLCLVQTQRERLERGTMLAEDIHCQYQRRLEMTTAEKDTRLRHERHLLLLELNALKDTLRHFESVEQKLTESQINNDLLEKKLLKLDNERIELETRVFSLQEVIVRHEREKTTMSEEAACEHQRQQDEIGNCIHRITELEGVVAAAQSAVADKETLLAAVSSDASSLSGILKEREDAIARSQTELKSTLEELNRMQTILGDQQKHLERVENENASVVDDLASLRAQLALSEQLVLEKDEEISTLEQAFQSESEAHLRDLKVAEDQQTALVKSHSDALRDLEAVLTEERADKALQGQAHQEANHQIQYLVKTLKRIEDELAVATQLLHEAEETLVVKVQQAEDSIAASLAEIEQTRRLEVEALRQEIVDLSKHHAECVQQLEDKRRLEGDAHNQVIDALRNNHEESLRQIEDARRLEAEALNQEIDALKSRHSETLIHIDDSHRLELEALTAKHGGELEQLAHAGRREVEALRVELSRVAAENLATAVMAHEEVTTKMYADHLILLAHAEEVYQVKLRDIEGRLMVALSEANETSIRCQEAEMQCAGLVGRVTELQRELDEKERLLAETNEVSRVRKAAIESLRKEMALMVEMERQAAIARGAVGPESGGLSPGRSMDHAILLLRQQLETFVNEDFHIEAFDLTLEDENDLLGHLKDVLRARYCLSTIGSPRFLGVADISTALLTLQEITRVHSGESTLRFESLPDAQRTIISRLQDYTALSHRVRTLIGANEDDNEATSLLNVLDEYIPVFSMMRELAVGNKVSSVHAARATALLAKMDDLEAFLSSGQEVLMTSRMTLQSEDISSLEDLHPFLHEAAYVRQLVQSHLDSEVSSGEVAEPTNDLLGIRQLKVLLEERQLLLLELSKVLGFRDGSLSRHQSVHIVDSVRELMRVVRAFESLSSSHLRDEMNELSVGSRAQSIIAFVEELRLIAQFAQNILEEEADVTAASANQSHFSSSSSLLSVRANLTRTPTPTKEFSDTLAIPQDFSEEPLNGEVVEANSTPASPNDFSQHELVLSDDALAPMEVSEHLRPSPSGALSESLLDISLVMSDHHRILSEAAHWVTKAHSLSPKKNKPVELSASVDFTAELSQIVRDHCALLSLGKNLFRLQDPRQDLPSVLECLAVIVRLSGRLGFLEVPMQTSGSSDSLRSSDSDSSPPHKEKAKVSLSVFASLDEIARHLQDYDNFIGQMVKASQERDAIDNVEALSSAITERLTLVERLRMSLGLSNAIEELPQFVYGIQDMLRRDSGQNDTAVVDMDTMLKEIGEAFQDRATLKTLLGQLRETLPFSSSVESPDELMERLTETLSQCDGLIQGKEQAWAMVENLTEQLATADKQRAEEDEVLGTFGNDFESTRVEWIERLIHELKTLRESNQEMLASITQEEDLLSGSAVSEVDEETAAPRSLCHRVETVRSLLEDKRSLLEDKSALEKKIVELQAVLAAEREQTRRAIDEERNFLTQRGIEWEDGESRISRYEHFISQLQMCKERDAHARLQSHLVQEAEYLLAHGFTLNTEEQEVTASRLVVYETLLNSQRVLIDEKVDREVLDQQELALLESEGIKFSSREEVTPRLVEVVKRLNALEAEIVAIKQRQVEAENLASTQIGKEAAFLEAQGITGVNLLTADARIGVYETLLARTEVVKQELAAWEGSPHGNASGCKQADVQRQLELERLEQEHSEAMETAIAAALEKQAQQIAFRKSVFGVDDLPSPSPPLTTSAKTAELIEAFTKRDNNAISMIYRLIRLTTDVLNTTAFTRPGGNGEIPVDLSQSVMSCVKELKALKEFLLQTLEEITRDSGAFAVAQSALAISRESVTERQVAIDYALLLHRDFAASVNQALNDSCSAVTSTIHALKDSLANHAADFSDAEAKCMATEMRAAEVTAAKQAIEAKYATQEEFLKRFGDERKRIETALLDALDEAKKERMQLQAQIESLEAEKNEAVAQANANAAALASAAAARPRTPLTASSRVPTAVVPTRPDKPRELTASRLKTSLPLAVGAVHKERFVSDLERETGQRRTANGHAAVSTRRANEWKRHELLSSSSQIEQQFRAMSESQPNVLSGSSDSFAPHPSDRAAVSLADQELWYQGVRLLQHVAFFVSVFFVPKQKTFRVEVFNSDSEQQQTIYVTLDEMQLFVRESRRAAKLGLTLDDASRHSEVVDVLFERVKVLGNDSSNLLFAFQ